MTFKETLKKHLADREITRKELEAKAGMKERSLDGYLDGNADPTAGKLRAIARALGVSMEKAYDYDFAEGGKRQSYQASEIARMFDDMPEDDRNICFALMEMLYKKATASVHLEVAERMPEDYASRLPAGTAETGTPQKKQSIKKPREGADNQESVI